MTNAELLAQAFPLHYQRIVEATYAQPNNAPDGWLWEEASSIMLIAPLASCFIWAQTSEGHEYWLALSGE